MTPAEALWDTSRVAQYLGMSVSWVRQRVAAGTIPCLRIGGWAVRFEPETIQRWARGESGPKAPVLPLRRGEP